MKRQVQKIGVRKYFGDDMIALQSEPLKAIDTIIKGCGTCILEGCQITQSGDNTYDISSGMVALHGTDPEGNPVFHVAPFSGAQGVALPIYLTLTHTAEERVYGDGKVKPIAYNYTATATALKPAPETPHLTLTLEEGNRLVDAIQNPTHRFLTDNERINWNAKETPQGALEKANVAATSAAAAALTSAKEHTAATATQTLTTAGTYTDSKTSETLSSAQTYTNQKVAQIVDSSPETLNTLNELATALGNDPNFATTVANQIGTKVDKTDPRLINARPASGGTANFLQWLSPEGALQNNHYLKFIRTNPLNANARLYLQGDNREYDSVEVAYATKSGRSDIADKIETYSVNDLFINKGADYSDINNLPADSGMWAVNHDGGGQNLPFPFGAVIQFAGARGAGGYPIFQMASRAGGSNFYVRSKWHNETLESNGWKELYHSGNFNPNAGEKQFNVQNTEGFGYIQSAEVTFNTSKLLFGANYGHNAKKDCFYIHDGNVYCINDLYVKDNAVYHSGNFNPATKADKTELATKADKSELNGHMKCLCAGVVTAGGSREKWKYKEFYPRKINTGYYSVDHNLGHMNYEVQLTAISREYGPMYASVFMKESNSILVNTANDTELDDSSFFFQIFEF